MDGLTQTIFLKGSFAPINWFGETTDSGELLTRTVAGTWRPARKVICRDCFEPKKWRFVENYCAELNQRVAKPLSIHTANPRGAEICKSVRPDIRRITGFFSASPCRPPHLIRGYYTQTENDVSIISADIFRTGFTQFGPREFRIIQSQGPSIVIRSEGSLSLICLLFFRFDFAL